MRPCFRQCLMAVLLLVPSSLATPQPVLATIVFDDHFDDSSGGMPEGWFLAAGTGLVVESGTVVDLLSSKVIISSEETLDTSAGTISVVLRIAGVTGTAMAGAGFGTADCHFGVLIRNTDGRVYVTSQDAEGGEQNYVAGFLSGYAGGPIGVTLQVGPVAFRIMTDSPLFDSGDVLYTAVFPTFTNDDLGSAGQPFLVNDVEAGETGSSSIDRITVDIEGATPVENVTLGRIKALFGR